jgi:tyrocidine synthetase-3
MKELAHLVLENTVTGKIDRKVASEILGLLKKMQGNSKEIAIIGISLKFPLANNLKGFWDVLANGTDCVRELPPLRVTDCNDALRVLNPNEQNKEFIKCGYLDEIDKFDCNFFRLTPREASLMDPQQRLFLQTAYAAIEDAGYGGTKLCGSNTGVYVGYNSQPLYSIMSNAAKEVVSELILIGATPSLIPSRISYLLNLRGPSILVDTACSSSLVAVHLACQAIRNGECDLAIAGGVKFYLNPIKILTHLGIESTDSKTKTFDNESDGLAWGEGVAAILLKPLDNAVKDRDQIYAVIKGCALNQDGTSIGITSPNVIAQEEVIQAAWRDAGIDPETISYIEAHGTGTRLGDPIEIEGIRRAFQRYTNRKQFCAIGSLKPNFGHLDSASGIASLIKAVLTLKEKQLPPSIHFQRPSRKIRFEDSPVFVNDRLKPWERGDTPRRCGISAFGFSGTNCHIILEEAPEVVEAATTAESMPRILALSAITEKALKELIRAYQTYLTEESTINIDDLCYTANTGRGHYGHRLLIFFQDFDDLKAKIDKISQVDLNGLYEPEIVYGKYQIISNSKLTKESWELIREEKKSLDRTATRVIDEIASQQELNKAELHQQMLKLGQLYIQGADFPWDRIYQNTSRRKLSIPGYPFQGERCWLEFDNLDMDIPAKIQPITKSTSKVELKGKESYTGTEQRLAEIWAEILGYKEISVTEDFYQLGGDSITVSFLTSRIHQEFNVELTLRQIFESSTIEAIGEIIEKAPKSKYVSIEAVPQKEYYIVSSAQKRLFILEQFEGVGTSYNFSGVFEVIGKIERERFENTIKQLLERHESFRTSFELIGVVPMQRIHPEVDFRLHYQELALTPGEVSPEETITGIIQEFIQPFDLRQAPLVRVGLLKISDNRRLLMFDMHHIITDGTSMNILIRDFMAIYNGETLTDLRIQYKDFSEWQHELFKGESIKRQEAYWLDRFAGEIPVLDLPTDYQRPAVQSFAGEAIHFRLDEALTGQLNQLAIQNGVTLYMVLLGVYTILLAKYSGQEDIIVGSPIAGRPHADLENIIGMFVNTLTMRNYPVGNKTFLEFLAEVKVSALQAYENQDYPFEELVEKLDLKRDLSRNPLFDCMFVFQNTRMETQTIGGLDFSPYPLKNETAKFDLTLLAFQQNEELIFSLEYGVKLFKPETIQRMIEHFRRLIVEAVSQPGLKVSELEMLTKAEKRQLINEFNDTKTEYPRGKTIQELFEEQVKRTPGNIALVYENRQMTYEELNQKANQLAQVLRKKGVKAESIVGIMVERSLEIIIGIMGILKAGGAYLPIDPEYPIDRIEYLLEDSQAILVITQREIATKFKLQTKALCLEEIKFTAMEIANLAPVTTTKDLAYLIYTSGSTGKPKAVMIEQQGLVNYITWAAKKYLNGENNSFPLYTTIAFDLTVTSIFTPLITGNKIIIFGNDGNKLALEDVITDNRVDIIKLTPAHLRLVQGLDIGKSNVKCLIVGGEQLETEIARTIYDKFNGKVEIYNEYGPTEATVGCMIYRFNKAKDKRNAVPIGVPADNVRIYILDRNLKPVPINVNGELFIAGDGLARGYLNQPELTGEKFIANPYVKGERMYRTGDSARMLPDGQIEYIGRIDNQVKIRGFRIELGEIENQLVKYEAIQEVVVISGEDKTGGKYLCAYLTAAKDLSVSEIREYLSKELPDYMIPSYFVQLEKLPLTPNGKLDRKALPEPERNLIKGTEYEAPQTETELELVRFWQDLLEVEQIGINNHFFTIGGHSLKAMVLVSRIHKELNVEIPLAEIFKKPTIKELAQYIEQAEKNIYRAIKPVTKKEYYPVSSAQKRLFIMEQLEKVGTSYNISGVFEVEGRLEKERLEETFKQLIGRHESFRTSFELIGGEPIQRIHPEVEFIVNYQELALSEASPEETISGIIQEFIQPFDLRQAPLVRAGLLKISDNKHLLMFDMHHIITDGTSMNILIRDFAAIYNGETLADLQIQYKDFSEWQREIFKGETFKRQESYWLNRFTGEVPVLNLPTDYPRPAVQSFAGEVIYFELDQSLTNGLNQLAVQSGATLYMVLLGAYTILLSKYSGQEDIIVGSPIAGRPHADLENIIGMFVNTLAMRNHPAGEKTFQEFLAEVKTNALQAYEHQDYPFEELVDKLNLKRDLSRNPLFDAMFMIENIKFQSQQINNLQIISFPMKNQTAKFDLTLQALETKEKLYLRLEYGTKLFKKQKIERMIEHFQHIIDIIVSQPEIKLFEIELLTEAEKQNIRCMVSNFNENLDSDRAF